MRIRLFIIRLLSGIKHSLGVLSFFFLAPTTDLTEEGKQTEAASGWLSKINFYYISSKCLFSLPESRARDLSE